MTELTPEKLREAADVVEMYIAKFGWGAPDDLLISPFQIRLAAADIEAEKTERAERDRAIEELAALINVGTGNSRLAAANVYDAGWRKTGDCLTCREDEL